VEPILYMTEWFLCVFIRTLPWDTILRVWDMFLCEGKLCLFQLPVLRVLLSVSGFHATDCSDRSLLSFGALWCVVCSIMSLGEQFLTF
jgi:hypothetical protein